MKKIFEYILHIVSFIIALILALIVSGILILLLFIINVWILNKFPFPFIIERWGINFLAIIFTGIQICLFPKFIDILKGEDKTEE